MGWLTLTGEADTDITAGSPRASHACWDKSPILTMKVKLSSTNVSQLKPNHHGGDPEKIMVTLHLVGHSPVATC